MKAFSRPALVSSHTAWQPASALTAIKRLKQLCQGLICFLAKPADINVQQISTREGHVYWRIYDPFTRQYTRFNSESEVRIWLEERYYR